MIKFFRVRRQNIIMENKTAKPAFKAGRYFKYAIGEIVLVVIGILIALQINNWNEHRKSKLQEVNILTKLNTDLKANLIETKGLKDVTEDRIKASRTILNYFEEHKAVDDSLKRSFELINNDDLFNNANTTYKYIENQGVNILTNDSILSKITWMYEHDFKNIANRERTNWEILTNDLRPLMDIHLEVSQPQHNDFKEVYELNKPINMEALSENKQFKNVIVRNMNFMLLRLRWQTETITELEDLIQEVEREIQYLNNL
jgi:hypothetical protein